MLIELRRGFQVHLSMISPTLSSAVLLIAMLSGTQAATAQAEPQPSPLVALVDHSQPPDYADLQRRRLLHDVAQAVIHLEASGDRTMDAIENSQVTLTLDSIEDNSRLTVLCINGGKALGVFVQLLAGELQLSGKVSDANCFGAGRDDDPFVLKFRLHYESGGTSLFSEQPPELTFIVEQPIEPDVEGEAVIPDAEAPQPQELKPLKLNPRRSQASHAVVQLPEGWTPVKLPDPMHSDSAFGTVDSKVTFADGTLTVDRKLALKVDKVEVPDLVAFHKWADLVEGSVSLPLRSTLYYPDRDASAGTEEQKKAAALIDEAYSEIEAHELAKAEVALNQAEAIDPGHEILHENRGELAAARGDEITALAEYRKELEAYPKALFEMSSITEAQRKLGDPDGQIATLQRWMVADPNSPMPATDLMAQYHDMGRDDLAVMVGDDAMNIMTKDAKRDVDFLLRYGREQMLVGQAGKATTTLEALLDLTVDDSLVNDAAYYLSEQGLSLDRAEQSVREGLTQFDLDDSANALSTSYADSAERTHLLLSTWDTLGWILYKKGTIQEAEQYVRAAWNHRQDIAISRHLGDILLAEEKPVEAMNIYTLGLATFKDKDAAQNSKNPDAIAVRDALAQLSQKGNASTVKDPKAALLALRTLDLGQVAKPRAQESCTVRLTASQLVIDTTEQNGAEEPIVISDGKLLIGSFPPDSKASLNLKGTIQCSKKCSLVFAP
jgi:predicted Zn-dependent protease